LLVPLLVGGMAALLVYYSWPAEAVGIYKSRRRRRGRASVRPRTALWRNSSPAAEGHGDGVERVKEPPPMPAPAQFVDDLVSRHGIRVFAIGAVLSTAALVLVTLTIVRVDWSIVGYWALAGLALGGVGWFAASREWSRLAAGLLLLASLAPIAGVVSAVADKMDGPLIAVMIGVTFGVAWMAFGALVDLSRLRTAVTLFVALMAWSGALAFLRDLGADVPELETARVTRQGAPALDGYYLGGSGGDVYVASFDRPPRVTVVNKYDVTGLDFGTAIPVDPKDRTKPGKQGSGGGTHTPGTVPVPEPDATVREVVASANVVLDHVPVHVDVLKPQRGGKLIVLNLRLTNTTSQKDGLPRPSLVVGELLDDPTAGARSDGQDTLDGLALVDLDASLRHVAAHDERGRCLCSHGLSRLELKPGETANLYVTFGAPPAGRKLALQMDPDLSIPLKSGG
jgi:hypothetical protein